VKLPIIRALAAAHTEAELLSAEAALLEGEALPFPVDGVDEGEQYTHILGALDVVRAVAAGQDEREALRAFGQRVRNSIG
jgi:hypothetical protein